MNIRFKTNIDAYRTVSWPVLDYLPNKGDFVKVYPGSESYCNYNKIPLFLEIVAITHEVGVVWVELWYRNVDVQAAKLSKDGTKHLFGQ